MKYKIISYCIICIFCCACTSPAYRYNELGVSYAQKGQYDLAIEQFILAHNEDKSLDDITMNLAKAYLMHGQIPESIATAQQILAKFPDHIEANLIVAQATLTMGDKDKSEEILSQLCQKNQKNPICFLALGQFYFQNKNWDEAITSYQKVIEFMPNYDFAYVQLGKAYLYKEFQKYDPKSLQSEQTFLEELERKGQNFDLSQSLVMFRKAVYLSPKNAEAHTMLGLIAFYSANYKEAELEFKEALQYEPKQNFLYLALAVTFSQMHEWKNAEEYLDKVQKAMPNEPSSYMLQIFIKIEQGSYAEALDLCYNTINSFPELEEKLLYSIAQHCINTQWVKQFLTDSNESRRIIAEKIDNILNPNKLH